MDPLPTQQTRLKWYKLLTGIPFFLIFLVFCVVAQGSNECLLTDCCYNQWIIDINYSLSGFSFFFSGYIFGRISSLLGNVLILAIVCMSHYCIKAHCVAGSLYLVWLSGPPQVSHCLPQSQSQALGLVSSPPSGALVAQTCLRPGEPPPGSCSGRRGCENDKYGYFQFFVITLGCFSYILMHCFCSVSNVKYYYIHFMNCNVISTWKWKCEAHSKGFQSVWYRKHIKSSKCFQTRCQILFWNMKLVQCFKNRTCGWW